MKHLIQTILFSAITFFCLHAQPNHLVISQVYGGGGNNGALFTHDFVELFNPTTAAISLSGLSLQYAATSAASWSKLDLSGTVLPGHYFLIKLGSGGSGGNALPVPDLSGSLGMNATGGTVALLENLNVIPANTCPSAYIDLVGYGSGTMCKEVNPVASPGAGESIWRQDDGCTDLNNNATDFITVAASPRNALSHAHSCGSGSVLISSGPNVPFCINSVTPATGSIEYTGKGTFASSTFNVYLSDVNGSFTTSTLVGTATVSGTNPTGSIPITIPSNLPSGSNYYLRINVSDPSLYSARSAAIEIINGAANSTHLLITPSTNQLLLKWTNPAGCFDEIMVVAKANAPVNGIPSGDGSSYNADANFAGAGTLFDGGKVVYKGTAGVQAITGLESYQTYYLKAFTRRGTSWSNGVEVSDFPRYLAAPGEIVINQLSPDYSNASDEYVELVNTTNKTFYLSDLAFAYQSAAGTSKISAFLTGKLNPHAYWLLSPNASVSAGKTAGLTRDGSINPGLALNAQIAILRKADNVIIDAVAYGNVTDGEYIEGRPAIAPAVDGGIKRKIQGMDNNNNNSDFIQVSNTEIELSNSTSLLANEGALIPGGSFSRLYVTGDASISGGVSIDDKVVLIKGRLSLSDKDLIVHSIEGGHSESYIKTNSTGNLQINSTSAEEKSFPIGNETFNPVKISSGNGLSWKARVQDELQDVTHNKAVRRTWHITPSALPPSGANLEFEYNDGDVRQVTGLFDVNEDVYMWTNHNNTWQVAGFAVRPSGTSAGTRKVSLLNWRQFSPFIITNVTGSLPVHFADEKLLLRSNDLVLTWTNLTENNIRFYEVERSPDDLNFTKLAEVFPAKNNGQSARYTYVDNSQFTGRLYYRVKAVEKDGGVRYSKIVSLDTGERLPRLLIYPNPAKYGKVSLHSKNLPTGDYTIYISNATGQQIRKQEFKHNRGWPDKSLFLNDLQPGYYMLRIEGPLVFRQWFVIE
ncbi:MAG TPA: lamin tail domain-containing protein [Chitinophagaceae bacterium]|nr:lamin tail domain-containing protein [Chitinophagaceae bacterium]